MWSGELQRPIVKNTKWFYNQHSITLPESNLFIRTKTLSPIVLLTSMSQVPVPQGLFARVIKRLGLEKQLQIVKRHLGWFIALLVVVLGIAFIAFLKFHDVLGESSFGPYLSLLRSDPLLMLRYWRSYGYSLFEALPSFALTIVFFSLGCLLLVLKIVMVTIEQWKLIKKSM